MISWIVGSTYDQLDNWQNINTRKRDPGAKNTNPTTIRELEAQNRRSCSREGQQSYLRTCQSEPKSEGLLTLHSDLRRQDTRRGTKRGLGREKSASDRLKNPVKSILRIQVVADAILQTRDPKRRAIHQQ